MLETRNTILIVDDNPSILECLQLILEFAGYRVSTMDKSEDIEQLFEGDLPNAIVLDMLLSGKDGREIVKQLKCQDTTKHIPILMISAHPAASGEAAMCGADDFLAKPFEMNVFLEKVAQFL